MGDDVKTTLVAGFLGLVFSVFASGVLASETKFDLLPGECWWGGHTFMGASMPYSAEKPFHDTLIDRNACNQTVGLLLSSKGRWLWNDEPFAFSFSNGVFRAVDNGCGRFQFGTAADKTLRGAFREASARFFPADGKLPDELLFSAPQWNTWVELTYNQNQRDILAYAESIVANGFTPGVLMVDDTWQHSYGVWDFNFKRFPDPKAMCARLHKMGFKLMLWVCPYVGLDTWEVREELNTRDGRSGCIKDEQGNVAVVHWWNGRSACVDFTSPLGREWFSSKLRFLQTEYGVDGFKFDAGDMSAYSFKFKAHTAEGSTAHGQSKAYGEVGLGFPLNEYRTVWQLAGRPLAQRLQDKGNSWRDLRQCVTDILACGILGYAFCCPDMIGGGQWTLFHGDAVKNIDFKVVARSAQMQALMPMMQFSLNPWRVMTKPDDAKYLDAISRAGRIRAKYADKILALARASAKTGEPIAAHMEYAFPGCGYERVSDQWVLGGDMIVAPILSGDDARKVELPAGLWRDDLGVEHAGPATLELANVPIERLPYYEKVQQLPGVTAGDAAALRREIDVLREKYALEKRTLGYADEFGVYHMTPEGKQIDELERRLKKLQGGDALDAARRAGWGTVPLGPSGIIQVPKKFEKKAQLGPRAPFRPGLRLFGEGVTACVACPPGDTNRLAHAREFAYHLGEMTGATIRIADCAPGDSAPCVLFGGPAEAAAFGVDLATLPEDTAVVRRRGNVLFVGGTDAGASHALTYVLEAMGCRYIWPGRQGKVIPFKKSVVLPEIDLVHTSVLKMRAIRAPIELGERHGSCLRRLGFDPEAFEARQRALYCDHPGHRSFWHWHGVNDGKGTPGQKKGPGKYKWGHYFKDYIARYQEAHPEWFALQPDGTRTQCEKERPTFCLSNEELIEETIRNLVSDFKANPGAIALSACLPDGGHATPCLCEKCRRLDPPDAAPRTYRMYVPENAPFQYVHMTDRVLWFMNRLADGVVERLPGKKLTTYAYSYYTDPPRFVKPSSNLVILSVAGDYVNAYPRVDGGDSRPYAFENMAAWSSFGNELLWRPNCIRGFNCAIPQNCARRIFNDLETFKANGTIGTDFDAMDEQWALKGLTFYMTAKAHHNIDRLDFDTLFDDYCSAFGAAKDEIKKYFLELERTTEAAADRRCGILGYIDFFDPVPFGKILARAEKAVEHDPIARRRVQFLATGLAFARRLKRNKAASDAKSPALMSLLEDYRDFMKEQYEDDDAFIAVNIRRIPFYDHILRPLLSRSSAQ